MSRNDARPALHHPLRQRGFRIASALSRTFRGAVYRTADRLALLAASSPGSGDRSAVLLTRTDQIGDFIMWLDAARALCSHWHAGGRRVVLLANSAWASWAGELGIGDEVWSLDSRRYLHDWSYRAVMLRRVAAGRFGLAVQARPSREAFVDDSLIAATCAPERVTLRGSTFNIVPSRQARSDAVYSRLVELPASGVEMDNNAALVRAIGVTDYRPKIATLGPGTAEAPATLAGRAYAVLFPAASQTVKIWPAERFAAVGSALAGRFGLDVVLAGGPGDRQRCADLARAMDGRAIDLSGSTTLPQLAEVLRGAKLLVSNDTSAVHIAAAVDTPSICILGGGHFGRFLPYPAQRTDRLPAPIALHSPMPCFGCGWTCHYQRAPADPGPCITGVTVEQTLDCIEHLLAPARL